MRLSKRLDRWHAEGLADGAAGGTPNPFILTPKYVQWAYDAGYATGQRQLRPPRPLPPPPPLFDTRCRE